MNATETTNGAEDAVTTGQGEDAVPEGAEAAVVEEAPAEEPEDDGDVQSEDIQPGPEAQPGDGEPEDAEDDEAVPELDGDGDGDSDDDGSSDADVTLPAEAGEGLPQHDAVAGAEAGDAEGEEPEGDEPEGDAAAGAEPVPVRLVGYTHDGHQAWGMLPTQRRIPLLTVRGHGYVIAGVNPPAQWEHNGRMVRLFQSDTEIEGWVLGGEYDLIHVKSNAWTGTWRVIGIVHDGKLAEGSELGYTGNDGKAVTLEGKPKAGLWLCRDRGESVIPPVMPVVPLPEAAAPAGDAKPEGEAPEGAQPEDEAPGELAAALAASLEAAKAETAQPSQQRQPQPGSGRRDKRRRSNLRSGHEGAGKPA